MGVATTRAPNGLGPPNPTKKLAHWMDLLGQQLSRNRVFEIYRGEPPFELPHLWPKNSDGDRLEFLGHFWQENGRGHHARP